MKMAFSDFPLRKKGVYGILYAIVLLLSLFLVISISIDTFRDIPFCAQSVYMKVQLWVYILSLFDFILESFLSKSRWHYLSMYFIFLLATILYQNVISYMGWTFSPGVIYMIRFVPLVRRGRTMAIVVGRLTYNKTPGLFVSYLTTLLAIVYLSSLALSMLEHRVNPLVTSYGDAPQWAFMDAITVDSNVIVVTVTGCILSMLLTALGMMMPLIFTAYVTSPIQKRNKEKKEYYRRLGAADGSK